MIEGTGALKATVVRFVLLTVAGSSALMVILISQIWSSLSPGIRSDLEWKARHGAAELVQRAGRGILSADSAAIDQATSDYVRDADVETVIVTDANGAPRASYGKNPSTDPFGGPKAEVRDTGRSFVSWN